MKKLAFTLFILAGALQLKAQQVPALPKTPPYLNFKLTPDTSHKLKFSVPPKVYKEAIAANVDKMPVAKMQGRSHMPVVQTDRTGYTMPIAGKNQSGSVYYMKKDSVVAAQ